MDALELSSLAKSARRRPLWVPDDDSERVAIGRDGIERLIPHRPPFLFVDEVTDVGLTSQSIRGRRRIDPHDPVFEGHVPGRPIYPGVLQLETIGQLGLCLMQFVLAGSASVTAATRPRDARAVRIHGAQFFQPVGPGEELTLVCRALAFDDYTAVCAGQVLRGDTPCSFGVMEVFFVDE